MTEQQIWTTVHNIINDFLWIQINATGKADINIAKNSAIYFVSNSRKYKTEIREQMIEEIKTGY